MAPAAKPASARTSPVTKPGATVPLIQISTRPIPPHPQPSTEVPMDANTLQLILLALQTAPVLVDTGKDLLDALKGNLDDDQRAELEAAQAQAHQALQDAVKAAVAQEGQSGN